MLAFATISIIMNLKSKVISFVVLSLHYICVSWKDTGLYCLFMISEVASFPCLPWTKPNIFIKPNECYCVAETVLGTKVSTISKACQCALMELEKLKIPILTNLTCLWCSLSPLDGSFPILPRHSIWKHLKMYSSPSSHRSMKSHNSR